MPTSFDIIEDMATTSINDYKLAKLYEQSIDEFKIYCDGFLYLAIPRFTRCKKTLDFDTEAREFVSDLNIMEQSILADLWVIEWLTKEINDAAQIQNKLQVSSSFTTHSPAENLKQKYLYRDGLIEKVSLKITNYLLEDIETMNIFQGW